MVWRWEACEPRAPYACFCPAHGSARSSRTNHDTCWEVRSADLDSENSLSRQLLRWSRDATLTMAIEIVGKHAVFMVLGCEKWFGCMLVRQYQGQQARGYQPPERKEKLSISRSGGYCKSTRTFLHPFSSLITCKNPEKCALGRCCQFRSLSLDLLPSKDLPKLMSSSA